MITFLASPKPFIGRNSDIQHRAILSWLAVHEECEVIIYGEGDGVADACLEMGVQHVPEIQCSSSGIPYFNSIIEHANLNARHDIHCYVNCDILLSSHIINAISIITFPRYLLVGQRIDLAEGVCFELTKESEASLKRLAKNSLATLHEASGMDYFIFPRFMWKGLPPLIIGRAGYDGALVAFCLRNNIPIVDCTYVIPAMHQFHDYSHVKGASQEVWGGGDAKMNKTLHRIKHSSPNTADADWQIRNGALVLNLCRGNWLRRLEINLRFKKGLERTGLSLRLLWRILIHFKLCEKHQEENSSVIIEQFNYKSSIRGDLSENTLQG